VRKECDYLEVKKSGVLKKLVFLRNDCEVVDKIRKRFI